MLGQVDLPNKLRGAVKRRFLFVYQFSWKTRVLIINKTCVQARLDTI